MKVHAFTLGVAAGLAATLSARAVRRYGVMRDRLDTAEVATRVLREDSRMLEERVVKEEADARLWRNLWRFANDRSAVNEVVSRFNASHPKFWTAPDVQEQAMAIPIGLAMGEGTAWNYRCSICCAPTQSGDRKACTNPMCRNYCPF